jgi:hypothetical protein
MVLVLEQGLTCEKTLSFKSVIEEKKPWWESWSMSIAECS